LKQIHRFPQITQIKTETATLSIWATALLKQSTSLSNKPNLWNLWESVDLPLTPQ